MSMPDTALEPTRLGPLGSPRCAGFLGFSGRVAQLGSVRRRQMTRIEEALFLNRSAHCVSAFELSPEALALTLHPWERRDTSVHAVFDLPTIVSRDDYADDGYDLPWDIIGFDSEPLSRGLWRFCLHTDCIEYVFDSPWPRTTRVA